jgi:hypothetical protein
MSYSTFIHSGIVNPEKPNISVKESQDAVDTVTLDIPLLTRLLELAREDLKSDIDLHFILTNILTIKNQGVLTMQDYEKILQKPSQTGEAELESIRKLAGI